jgi:CubicO group peptidase (beta-lactamase class C family)
MVVPHKLPMLKGTLFDLASLTKSIATATSVMILKDRGQVDLGQDVSAYLPEFTRKGISVFHLLTHTSGLSAWKPLYLEVKESKNSPINKDENTTSPFIKGKNTASPFDKGGLRGIFNSVINYLGKIPLDYETGSKVVYSCLGYILLGEMIRRLTGIRLDEFARKEIFEPLGMKDTFYNPPEDRKDECAATEDSNSFEKRMTNYRDHKWREGVVVGEVHDENAHFLCGVAGNAGLFSTASDLMKYSGMLINGGDNILSSDAVRMISTVQTPELNESRGIGWIILTDGTLYHTGFTGTAMWTNLENHTSVTLLTNRVHPDATKEGIVDFRQTFYKLFVKPFFSQS